MPELNLVEGPIEGYASKEERPRKIIVEGKINFSFGKNGRGLSDELIQIGTLINQLSKDNYIYLEDSFIDTCDDVYDLKFNIVPHDENKWLIESFDKNKSEGVE